MERWRILLEAGHPRTVSGGPRAFPDSRPAPFIFSTRHTPDTHGGVDVSNACVCLRLNDHGACQRHHELLHETQLVAGRVAMAFASCLENDRWKTQFHVLKIEGKRSHALATDGALSLCRVKFQCFMTVRLQGGCRKWYSELLHHATQLGLVAVLGRLLLFL